MTLIGSPLFSASQSEQRALKLIMSKSLVLAARSNESFSNLLLHLDPRTFLRYSEWSATGPSSAC
jgi:hypothetical protein